MSAGAIETGQFIPISPATIRPSSVTGFPLYIRKNSQTPIELYRGADYPLQREDLERLMKRGVKRLYVSADDHEQYQLYLRSNFTASLSDETVPLARRFQCLNEVVRDVLAEAFRQRDTEHTVTTARDLASLTVQLVCREDFVVGELLQVLHHDYHTFTHSANVSYYSVLLAKASGIVDPEELRQIAAGGMLHDVGKLNVPETVLKQKGRLNDDEWEVIKRHPTTGFRLLAHREDLTFGQLMMVYQHHEREDGSGYPVGTAGPRIHPWAQLCAVVDVYEALTSHRPYRPAMPLDEVLTIIDRQAEERLNQGLWECWKTIINAS
jgi:HD-GYP domain-containing protein (c-di-GMP phosphodiesterase class II)